jgi:hypothetical protein
LCTDPRPVDMKRPASEKDPLACAGCGVAPPEGKRHMSCPLCEDLQFPMIHFCSMNCPANPWPGHWIWHDEQMNAGAVQDDGTDETLQHQQAMQQAQEQPGTSGEHMNMPAPHAEARPAENRPSTAMLMPSPSVSTSTSEIPTVMVQTPLLVQPLRAITVTQVIAQPPPRASHNDGGARSEAHQEPHAPVGPPGSLDPGQDSLTPRQRALHVARQRMQIARNNIESYQVFHTLAVALGASRVEGGTILALHAVLLQMDRPGMSKKEAYTATGASMSNFTRWKRRVLYARLDLPPPWV